MWLFTSVKQSPARNNSKLPNLAFQFQYSVPSVPEWRTFPSFIILIRFEAADILHYSGLGDFAKKMRFAYIAFQGLKHSIYENKIRFNVGKDSEPVSLEGPDDVAYVRHVLDQAGALKSSLQAITKYNDSSVTSNHFKPPV